MTVTAPAWLENLSDFATVALAVIGFSGAVFGYIQIRHVRKARLAPLYLSFSREWDALREARTIVTTIPFENREPATNDERGRMLLDILQRRLAFESDGEPDSMVNEIQCHALESSLEDVLSYLEDLGLLCRQDYIARADVFDIIGSSIREIIEIMLPYIERDRIDYGQDPTIHANALWLYECVKTSSQFSIGGYGAPSLFFRSQDRERS